MKVKPIKPNEVSLHKQEIIPDEVFTVFNELIAENFSGRSSRVCQEMVIQRVIKIMNIERRRFNTNWLNIEDCYRKAGWKVEYDKPGYNETYKAFFVFSY